MSDVDEMRFEGEESLQAGEVGFCDGVVEGWSSVREGVDDLLSFIEPVGEAVL